MSKTPNNAVQIEKQVNFHKLCLWLLSFHCRLSKRLIYSCEIKMNSRSFLVAFTQQLRSLSTIWPHFSESIINWILNNAPKTKMGLFFPMAFFVQSLWSAIICLNWTQHNNQHMPAFSVPHFRPTILTPSTQAAVTLTFAWENTS